MTTAASSSDSSSTSAESGRPDSDRPDSTVPKAVSKTVAETTAKVSSAVAKLYDTYPFPPEPILDEAPPGYNWRWHWPSAYSFCSGRKPLTDKVRILDAGCGTGVGTEYLVHLNPAAEVVGMDLSAGAIAVATERCQRSGADRVTFHNVSIYDVDQIPGEFDLINCVGVLHHMPDPIRGIQALSKKLKPGGILHVFVYAELGRWEIQLTQEAIALLQGDRKGDYTDGVHVGRSLFAALPEENRLRKREETRWALENHRDECFADMYVHPQEVDYNVKTLFELIDSSGLDFVGFSNPQYWDLSRLISDDPSLMERADGLGERDRYRLIELLDPEITHYEFFLSRPPLEASDWSNDEALLAAAPERHACMEGWPSRSFFNFDYQVISINEDEFNLLEACAPAGGADGQKSVGEIIAALGLKVAEGLDLVRSLQARQLVLLAPSQK